jgi:hypothetical protein
MKLWGCSLIRIFKRQTRKEEGKLYPPLLTLSEIFKLL